MTDDKRVAQRVWPPGGAAELGGREQGPHSQAALVRGRPPPRVAAEVFTRDLTPWSPRFPYLQSGRNSMCRSPDHCKP